MKVKVNGKMEAWHGIWPVRKNSRRIVCVLTGSAHTGLEGAEYLGTHYSRISREHYDWYRLPAGTKIIRAVDKEGIMKYTGKAQNKVTGQEWTTKAYDSYEVAHRAAEKLANKHIPAGNAFIYVVDDSGERV